MELKIPPTLSSSDTSSAGFSMLAVCVNNDEHNSDECRVTGGHRQARVCGT